MYHEEIISLTACFCSCIFFTSIVSASVIQLSAPNNIQYYLNTLNDGDVIELTSSGGNYVWSAQVAVNFEKAITIRAKKGLSIKPTVTFSGTSGAFIRYNSISASMATKKWLFDGIVFDGYNNNAGYYAPNFFISAITYPGYGVNIEVNNCVFKNISQRAFHYTGAGAPSNPTVAQGGDLNVLNSEFNNCALAAINANASLSYSPNNVVLFNNLFTGIATNHIILNTGRFNSYLIDHCTFENSTYQELQLSSTAGSSFIRNSLFVNNKNASSNNYYNATVGTNCGIYYSSTGSKNTIYPFSTTSRVANPQLNKTTGIATATSYLTATTDGLPTGYFGIQILTSENEINNLNYTLGNGPSASKSFTLSASRITNSTLITAPANFEVSLNQNTGFAGSLTLTQSGGSIASTTIYVRLKSGLTSNYYAGVLQLTSTGAATQQINLSGVVTDKPSVFTSVASLSGFTYTAGAGPSLQQLFTINAASLTGQINVTASSNFEISLNSGSSFSASNSLNILNSSGLVSQLNIYVRLKAGLTANNYSGTITLKSREADDKIVSLSAIVLPSPAVLTVNKTAISNINYSFGNGPSTIQSFTVSGTGLSSNISVNAPANYEISFLNGTSFSGNSSLTLSPNAGSVNVTNIYIRLRKDRAVGTYDEKVQILSAGATTKELGLSGFVTEAAGISVSLTSISGMEYIVNNGPSSEKSFVISGAGLVASVIVTAAANFEVSTTSGDDFEGSGQIMFENSMVNGVAVPIYVRLAQGLPVGTYSGTINITSSGATTKKVALTANVYNPLQIVTDPATYDKRFLGKLSLSNKWILSKNTNNYTYGNELVAGSGAARDVAMRNGKMLFADRLNKQIVIVDGETGVKEKSLSLNTSMFSYLGRNKANTADSTYLAGSAQFYSIKTDDVSTVLIGNQISSNLESYQIYKIDMATGNGTLLIDQSNLATLFPQSTTMRLDFFSVWGDVNSNAVILAANGISPAMEVFKWTISNGIVGAPVLIRLDNITTGTSLSGLESLGGYPRTYSVTADKFYVDGGGTYPTLVNASGSVQAGFYQRSSALTDSISSVGLKWLMDTGYNGMSEFSVGDQHFFVSAASNAVGVPPASFRLFKFKDSAKNFSDVECLWTFPKAGMGTASNTYRTAMPLVEVNGNTAKIYVYVGENGFAKYELGYDPLATSVKDSFNATARLTIENNKIIFSEFASKLMVYNLMGQLIIEDVNTQVVNAPTAAGIYIVKAYDIAGAEYTQKVIVK